MGFSLSHIGGGIVNGGRHIADALNHNAVVGSLKFASTLTAPINLVAIGKSTKQLCSSVACVSEKIDAGLRIGNAIQGLGNATEKLAHGLNVVGAVTKEAISWIKPLSYVGIGMEAFSMAFGIKAIVEISRVEDEFAVASAIDKSPAVYTLQDYRNGLRYIEEQREKNKSFLVKMFDIDEDKLGDYLVDIEVKAAERLRSSDEDEHRKARETLHSGMRAINKRLLQKKRTHWVELIASIVGLIAFALIFTPAMPLSLVLGAGSFVASIARFLIDRYQKKRFLSDLERLLQN